MATSLTHPQRQSRQYAYSERDIAYLEKQGWVREKLPEQVAALLQAPDHDARQHIELMKVAAKRGRPRKS